MTKVTAIVPKKHNHIWAGKGKVISIDLKLDDLTIAQAEQIIALLKCLHYLLPARPCYAYDVTWHGLGGQCLNCGATATATYLIKHAPQPKK